MVLNDPSFLVKKAPLAYHSLQKLLHILHKHWLELAVEVANIFYNALGFWEAQSTLKNKSQRFLFELQSLKLCSVESVQMCLYLSVPSLA